MAMSKYGYHHPSHVEATQPLHKFMKYCKFVRPQTNLIMFLVLQPAVITHTCTHMHMDTHTNIHKQMDTHTHTNIHMQMDTQTYTDTQQQTDKGTYTLRLYQYGFFNSIPIPKILCYYQCIQVNGCFKTT